MNIRHKLGKKTYYLTNENLKVGDLVYPISKGQIKDDIYYHMNYDWRNFMSGFPKEPHNMLDLKHSDYKPYEARTDAGYSPIECYYKIVEILTN